MPAVLPAAGALHRCRLPALVRATLSGSLRSKAEMHVLRVRIFTSHLISQNPFRMKKLRDTRVIGGNIEAIKKQIPDALYTSQPAKYYDKRTCGTKNIGYGKSLHMEKLLVQCIFNTNNPLRDEIMHFNRFGRN